MRRPRLDYVSPLPPVRSGIADYSRDILPELAEVSDLRVLRLAGQPVAGDIEARWSPAPQGQIGEEGRLPLYQMGNNRHHAEVWRLAHQVPGVLVLHDLVLHHLVVELTLGEGDPEGYRDHLIRDHGWVGETVARARHWGELGQAALFELPVRRTLLRRQRGVLVHSRWAAEMVSQEDSELAVRAVSMAVRLPQPIDPAAIRAWRQRAGLPSGPLLGSFGFQTPIKRTDRMIAALARPELAGAHLLIGGEVAGSLDLEAVAREAGVADRVHFLGFLDDHELQTAISACDVCINLRYPTAGETSAALLRVLALGRPALVSDYAQFADLPDEVTVKVPLGDSEVAALAARAGELLHQPERLEAMGEAARAFVRREHGPARAAREVADACLEFSSR
ncbi:MAG: glycosyltransferase family 4 protein, partial [Thermoanaerobaculia bacterium]